MDISHKTILLAEDDRNDEELFRRAIAQANINCRVDVARDGEELVRYLIGTADQRRTTRGADVDLVLLDLKMPKLNGLQVLTVMHNAHRVADELAPPIVVFTSSDAEQDVSSAYALGAVSYVPKPVSHGRFVETVQQLVLYWLGVNRRAPRRPRGVVAASAAGWQGAMHEPGLGTG
ncbi:MAG: response regulator [Pirellulales bacterium]